CRRKARAAQSERQAVSEHPGRAEARQAAILKHRAMGERLTFKSVEVRAVAVPLKRPVIAKVGSFTEWPVLLIDLYTQEGIIGRSYLGPFLKDAARYIMPQILHIVVAIQ